MPERIVNVSLRVPEGLHRVLSEWAAREQRSLHGQILYTLDAAARASMIYTLEGALKNWCREHGKTWHELADFLGISESELEILSTTRIGPVIEGGWVGSPVVVRTWPEGVIRTHAKAFGADPDRLVEAVPDRMWVDPSAKLDSDAK